MIFQETMVCIASGPSLTQNQIDLIGQNKDWLTVIAINDNWQWEYNESYIADHLYAADERWWNVWIDEIEKKYFKRQ